MTEIMYGRLRSEADRAKIKQLTKDINPIQEYNLLKLQYYDRNSISTAFIVAKNLGKKEAEELMALIRQGDKDVKEAIGYETYNQEFCRFMIKFYEKKLEEWRKTPNIPVCEMWIEKGEKKLAWFEANKDKL